MKNQKEQRTQKRRIERHALKVDKVGIEALLAQAEEALKTLLPLPNTLTTSQAQAIIRRYTACILGNFIPWMASASLSARSLKARQVAEANLYDEVRDDHPAMLRRFAVSAQVFPDGREFAETETIIEPMAVMVREMHGLKTVTLMATLERTSALFIPLLASLSKQCGGRKLTYTEVHGEADVAHALEFTRGLIAEAEEYDQPTEAIKAVFEMATRFLEQIFTPPTV
ncbi:MAG: hypothetical protein COV10_04395 [Candidatus Vogelbacteria bacterium CG10_big_fil_rev_8_21_14_0_10_51_16]|uniref:Pyrroloquinoline quinone biosynthesis protein PqqC n=1 Tax=Candidatus Vogelbacteria bacterium CG10_big_fil_rev_8_21_14_0_10_51_16 TaxID=1975045 RepID=A0A2H0RF83_9BACT|nr:MAG: hypothetical protein COV10_04395 [Candidatus Vogelbacteria bacterium CG10_big_fil_rev_8_21_14_0_10_51_16]